MSEFRAEAPQATARAELAHGPYVVARAGFEPTTLQMKGDESTNEPPCPTIYAYGIKRNALKCCKPLELNYTFEIKQNSLEFM